MSEIHVPPMKLSGLEPVAIGASSLFVNIGAGAGGGAPAG
jgi:5-methyltetrahydrofolate--homocysteine methyltransferase